MVVGNTLRLKLASCTELGKIEDDLNNKEGHNNRDKLKEKKNFKTEEVYAYKNVTETPVYRQCYNELGRNISCSSLS